MTNEKLIVSKYYQRFLKDVAIGLDQLDNDLQFISTIQKYIIERAFIKKVNSMDFAVENSTGMSRDMQKCFHNKNAYVVSSYNSFNGDVNRYITAKFHKVYKLTDDEAKHLQPKPVHIKGTNDSGFIRNNKIMFNKWQFTTEELLKIKEKTIVVISDSFTSKDFKPQIISRKKPLRFNLFFNSQSLSKRLKFNLLYNTILNDLKWKADYYIAEDIDCCNVLEGAMISSFINCTESMINETTNKYNMSNHFKISFASSKADDEDKKTIREKSGITNYKIVLYYSSSTICCDLKLIGQTIAYMDRPFGRYEELNKSLTSDLNNYLLDKYNGKYKVELTNSDGVFPIYRNRFDDDEQDRMIKQFKQSFLDNCHEFEHNTGLKFTLYETNSQVDDSIIYHLKVEYDI